MASYSLHSMSSSGTLRRNAISTYVEEETEAVKKGREKQGKDGRRKRGRRQERQP